MGLDDMVSRESAFVAAATAAVLSPRTRETMRKGAVLGVAGVLKAGDVVVGAARGATRGVRGAAQGSPASGTEGNGSRTPARTRRSGGTSRARTASSSRRTSSAS